MVKSRFNNYIIEIRCVFVSLVLKVLKLSLKVVFVSGLILF